MISFYFQSLQKRLRVTEEEEAQAKERLESVRQELEGLILNYVI